MTNQTELEAGLVLTSLRPLRIFLISFQFFAKRIVQAISR